MAISQRGRLGLTLSTNEVFPGHSLTRNLFRRSIRRISSSIVMTGSSRMNSSWMELTCRNGNG